MAVKKGQIVRVDKEKYLNSVNVSFGFIFFFFSCLGSFCFLKVFKLLCSWRLDTEITTTLKRFSSPFVAFFGLNRVIFSRFSEM